MPVLSDPRAGELEQVAIKFRKAYRRFDDRWFRLTAVPHGELEPVRSQKLREDIRREEILRDTRGWKPNNATYVAHYVAHGGAIFPFEILMNPPDEKPARYQFVVSNESSFSILECAVRPLSSETRVKVDAFLELAKDAGSLLPAELQNRIRCRNNFHNDITPPIVASEHFWLEFLIDFLKSEYGESYGWYRPPRLVKMRMTQDDFFSAYQLVDPFLVSANAIERGIISRKEPEVPKPTAAAKNGGRRSGNLRPFTDAHLEELRAAIRECGIDKSPKVIGNHVRMGKSARIHGLRWLEKLGEYRGFSRPPRRN